MRRFRLGWVAAAAFTVPGLVLAQGTIHRERQARGETVEYESEQRKSEHMFNVHGGAGVMTYAGEAAGLTAPGASYNVSVDGRFTQWLRGELGYLGGVYNSEQFFSNDRSTVIENGGQALAKVGADLAGFYPHALGGVSGTFLSVTDEQASAGLLEDGMQWRIPVGVGVDWELPSDRGASSLMVGARGVYSFGTNSDAFPTLDGGDTNTVTGMLQVGGAF